MTNEEAIEILKKIIPTPKRGDSKSEFNLLISLALSMGIKALEQESKTDMLDKIRAEIEQEYNKYRNMSEKWSERACGIGTTLEIIDKYKADSIKCEGCPYGEIEVRHICNYDGHGCGWD